MATIKLSNSVLLDPSSVSVFVNFNDIVASGTLGSITFTASKDCYLFAYGSGSFVPNVGNSHVSFLMRKGDIKSLSFSSGSSGYKAYGLK